MELATYSEDSRVGFKNEEWVEIENVLNNQEKEEDSKNDYYQTWTKEQLINEIKWLKAKLEKEKNKNNLKYFQTSQKLETQLQKAESVLSSFETPSNSPKPNSVLPIISVVGLVVLVGGLIAYKVKKNKVKR